MKAKDIEYKPSGKVVATITSDSGNEYTLHREKNGETMCSCPATKVCKHIREYKFKEELERVFTLKDYQGKINFQSEGSFEEIVNVIMKLRKTWES